MIDTTPRPRVRALAALTDGAGRWVNLFRFGDWLDAFAALRTGGPATLIRRVRAAEQQDRNRRSFPRDKVSDDASAAYAELRSTSTA